MNKLDKRTTSKIGRPRVENKQVHQRIAIYPETYDIFRKLSKKSGVYMTVWLNNLAKKLEKEDIRRDKRWYKKIKT